MRLLLVKTSSLGDVIHNLPVATDLARQFPGVRLDWLVEEGFAAIPRLHPAVGRVIPVAVRRWRKNLLNAATWREMAGFVDQVRQVAYDAVLDTQGLLKSALLASRARGPRLGYDAASAREPLASSFYHRRFAVAQEAHAVVRNRQLAAAAFGYRIDGAPDYGIAAPGQWIPWMPVEPCAVFLTATSRDDKLWPEAHWAALGKTLAAQGRRVVLPAGNPVERARAARLAAAIPGAVAAPPSDLGGLATLLAQAEAVVGVDTGLTHLAVALDVPAVALYTATEPGLTGVLGRGVCHNLGGRGQVPTVDDVLAALAEARR